jgi:hypothetical protein
MASIQPVNGKYRAQVAVKGVRKSAMFDKERDAIKWAAKTEAEIKAGAELGKTFGEAVAKYKETVSSTKDHPEAEGRRLADMSRFFKDETPIRDIDSEAIGRWRDHRLKTVSGSTVVREANLLRNVFLTAMREWRWIDTNPFKGVRLPKEAPARHQVWGWRDIHRVLRQDRGPRTNEMIRAFHICLHTALRLKEVLGATYDARRRVLVLGKTKTTRPGEVVEVPVTRRAARVLPALMAEPFTVGPNLGSVLFSKMTDQMLIDGLTFHDSRATALTLLARRMDVMTLARISRHKDLKILLSTYYRESAEKISARL